MDERRLAEHIEQALNSLGVRGARSASDVLAEYWTNGLLADKVAAHMVRNPLPDDGGQPPALLTTKEWKSLTIPVEDGSNVAGPLAANVLGSNAGEGAPAAAPREMFEARRSCDSSPPGVQIRQPFETRQVFETRPIKCGCAVTPERLADADVLGSSVYDEAACDGDCCSVPPAEVSSTGKAPDTVVLTTDQVAEMLKDSAPEPRAKTWRDLPSML